jgi:small subunit ribosomal protein S16
MLTIRMMRTGKKNRPFYRIVVQESRKKSNGTVLDNLGTYDPVKDAPARINQERLNKWLAQGAKISPSAKALARKALKAAGA